MSYLVVLEGTGEPGSNYKGIRVYIDYQTPEHFAEVQAAGANKDIVVAHGVTDEEAKHLCDIVPLETFLAAAWTEANESGEFDRNMYNLKCRMAHMREHYIRTGRII